MLKATLQLARFSVDGPKHSIALCGPIASGKTTTAEYLARHHGFTRTSFAVGVKIELAHALATTFDPNPYSLEARTDENLRAKHLARMTGQQAEKRPYRAALQFWGTELRRTLTGSEYWTDRMAAALNIDRLSLHVIDDCRFENEYRMLRNRNFLFFRLLPNPEAGPSLLTRVFRRQKDEHASERDWKRFQYDAVIPWVSVEDRAQLILLHERRIARQSNLA